MDPVIAIASLSRFDFEGILADPIRLGISRELAQTIIELEPRAREAAITLALRGKEIPGLPVLPEIVAKILGNVSENRWQMLCEATGRPDGEKEVSQMRDDSFFEETGHQGSNSQQIETED